MVLFWPIQQELDCIDENGRVLGKIKFDGVKGQYAFNTADESISLSSVQKSRIIERLAGLASGKYTIPMQDDD